MIAWYGVEVECILTSTSEEKCIEAYSWSKLHVAYHSLLIKTRATMNGTTLPLSSPIVFFQYDSVIRRHFLSQPVLSTTKTIWCRAWISQNRDLAYQGVVTLSNASTLLPPSTGHDLGNVTRLTWLPWISCTLPCWGCIDLNLIPALS